MYLVKSVLVTFVTFSAVVGAQEIQLHTVAGGLNFPTDIQSPPDGSGRLFVTQRNGLIRIISGGSVLGQPFLDLRGKVTADGQEQGLLGMAFSPRFSETRQFYVNYTNTNGDTVIARYQVSGNPNVADPTETILLGIAQPFANHNGGQLQFGPDGFLYIGMGDGGGAGDPQNNAQNPETSLGKLLRMDVEGNPGARPEIWAYGLRNPWRFSFDRPSGNLWIADVGQTAYEEINVQPASARGLNYGWSVTEGMHCYRSAGCSFNGLSMPVAEYDHGSGCSVTGGYVYRGDTSPGLRGVYLYGDFCSGRIWGIESRGGQWVSRALMDSGLLITTFGQDQAGEVYVADARGGVVYRLEGAVAPQFTAADVVNSASFENGLVPGSLATVFVRGVRNQEGITAAPSAPLPFDLGGVSVAVNGQRVPLLAVANVNGTEQINFQAPFELQTGAPASVVVTHDNLTSAEVPVPVENLQPAIFVREGIGAVVHANYQLVTPGNPLVEGEGAFLYAVGLGPVTNAPAAGSVGPVSPLASAIASVRLTIDGAPADVSFAGLAPGLVGVYQVNFRTPLSLPSGLLTMRIGAGGDDSPGVQVPVR
jgi:uncharacterized protein (TIGR03437 family)